MLYEVITALMKSTSPTKGRLARWRVELARYNLVLCYIEGKRHGAADLLSRPSESTLKRYADYIENVVDVREDDPVITSYSIHYTKLYDDAFGFQAALVAAASGLREIGAAKLDDGTGIILDDLVAAHDEGITQPDHRAR